MELKEDQTFQILVPMKVSGNTVRSILWGAFNQGSTYWLNDIIGADNNDKPYTEQIIDGETLTIIAPTSEDDSNEEHSLTLVTLLDGLKQYVEEYGDCIVKGEVDSCLIDSVDCDIILQYALFGEQIFA